MKILSFIGAAMLATGLGGCANVAGPVPASLSFYAAPIGLGPTSSAAPEKRGEACASNILGVVATGNASIDAAKKNAGITKVVSVEHSSSRVLGYYARFCTIVRGE